MYIKDPINKTCWKNGEDLSNGAPKIEIITIKRIFRFLPKIYAGHGWSLKFFAQFHVLGPFPDSGSRIPDPKTATKKRDEKKFVIITFFVATNFTKLNIILFLKCWRKNFWPNFEELFKFLPKKLALSSKKYGFGIRDPRSGIRINLFRNPDLGVKNALDPGSGSATLAKNIQ